jgi:hypothetical protein
MANKPNSSSNVRVTTGKKTPLGPRQTKSRAKAHGSNRTKPRKKKI